MFTLDVPAQVALVIAAVAALRIQFPKAVDGFLCIVTVAVLSLIAVIASHSEAPRTVWDIGSRAGLVFLYAVGGMSAAKQLIGYASQNKDGGKDGQDAKSG